jgi:hypothetical protein
VLARLFVEWAPGLGLAEEPAEGEAEAAGAVDDAVVVADAVADRVAAAPGGCLVPAVLPERFVASPVPAGESSGAGCAAAVFVAPGSGRNGSFNVGPPSAVLITRAR